MIKYLTFLLVMASAMLPDSVLGSRTAMQAPPPQKHSHYNQSDSDGPETSTPKLVLLGAIDFYRYAISPHSGSRCGFSPSCSAFGRQAVKDYGPVKGLMMTADRLTRCNFFKEPDHNYLYLPNGKLFDPVSYNAMEE